MLLLLWLLLLPIPVEVHDDPDDGIRIQGKLPTFLAILLLERGLKLEGLSPALDLLLVADGLSHEDVARREEEGSVITLAVLPAATAVFFLILVVLLLLLAGGDEAEEPLVICAHAAESDLVCGILGQFQSVMVDQDDLVREDAEEDDGVDLLLDAESPDAVTDGVEAGASTAAAATVLLGHLDRTQVTDDGPGE